MNNYHHAGKGGGSSADDMQAYQDSTTGNMQESVPFSSQLQFPSGAVDMSMSHQHSSFDMAAMTGALPPLQPHMPQRTLSYSSPNSPAGFTPPQVYGMQQIPQYQPHPGQMYADPSIMARAQQQQFLPGHYPASGRQIPHGMSNPAMPYGYAMNMPHYSTDMRYGVQQGYGGYTMQNSASHDYSATAQKRQSETAPVPSFPRGPPRKPRQSGHALWVGNLPPSANVTDLKDHFSRDATRDIESLFLISKSNCAFVNYRTEASCIAAMNRFHDSRFGGVRLVCRLRRGSSTSTAAIASPTSNSPDASQNVAPITASQEVSTESTKEKETDADIADGTEGEESTAEVGDKISEKYFIVKSLTLQDLESSVRKGVWATQSHNESTLNDAYDKAENVYLIFSANKSGEYFGYARMSSQISGEPVKLGVSTSTNEEPIDSTDGPRSIPTPATETAPKGRIIDDSARGTIFWEAEHSDDEDDSASGVAAGGSGSKGSGNGGSSQEWGRQFQIEWLSTARLPFYRTRGLRNPWNANREVKIARDGTELEPSIGRRLVGMFHRPADSPSNNMPPNMVPGMPYMQ